MFCQKIDAPAEQLLAAIKVYLKTEIIDKVKLTKTAELFQKTQLTVNTEGGKYLLAKLK